MRVPVKFKRAPGLEEIHGAAALVKSKRAPEQGRNGVLSPNCIRSGYSHSGYNYNGHPCGNQQQQLVQIIPI
jgi:hypothetical protein